MHLNKFSFFLLSLVFLCFLYHFSWKVVETLFEVFLSFWSCVGWIWNTFIYILYRPSYIVQVQEDWCCWIVGWLSTKPYCIKIEGGKYHYGQCLLACLDPDWWVHSNLLYDFIFIWFNISAIVVVDSLHFCCRTFALIRWLISSIIL